MKKAGKALALVLLVLLALGQCVNVSAGTKSASKKYEVKLNKTIYTMKKGKTVKLKATLNKAAKGKKVVWSSSNKKIAAVNAAGKVTAKKKGKATITAKIKGTKVKANCKITVGTPVSSIKLAQKAVALEPGVTFKLKATLSPKKPSNKKITFASSNKQIVSVSSKGLLTAKKEGSAKITVAAMDGSGKKAACKVTVSKKKIAVTSIKLNATNASLEPGQTKQLTASVNPTNATDTSLQWSSTNAGVVTVSQTGLLQASGEGTATVYAAAANGIRAACSIKVSYNGEVTNQTELNHALSSKMVTHIKYTSNKAEHIVIPEGDYSTKTIEIHAPNAEVTNNGRFSKVTIYAIAQNTYTENANNVIEFYALEGRIVIGARGIAAIHLSNTSNQNFSLENNGAVRDLQVLAKTFLTISGQNTVPVSLRSGAAGSRIVTEAELAIRASAKWDMLVLPGAENTKATIDNQSCMPNIKGIGCIPVTVSEDSDIINVPAQKTEDAGISQKVTVSGNIQEYALAEVTASTTEEPSAGTDKDYQVQNQPSAQIAIYMLPYEISNSGLNTENYANYITGTEAAAVTDANGNYNIPDVLVGNYWLIVKKENFQPVIQNLFITSFHTETYANSQIDLLSDTFADIPNAPEISGTIVDGLTGGAVNAAGMIVKLRTGSGNIVGTVVKTAVTDEDGRYAFTDVPAGIYTIEAIDVRQGLPADAIRYNPANTTIVVADSFLNSNNYNLIMNQQMQSITGTGLVQFTLEWGTEESGASSDIDSHLIGPRADAEGTFHVYYSDKSYSVWEDEEESVIYADLDVDDTTYEGPEHTTIYKETPGIYRFYIHNFSEGGASGNMEMMAKSSIKVTITIGSSTYTYYCPNQAGNLWYVCDYNSITHTIIPKNIVSTFPEDESFIGMTEEELNAMYLESEKENALLEADDFESYLTDFNDTPKKTEYLDKIAGWKNQVSVLTNYQEARQLRMEIANLYENIMEETGSVGISADNLYSYSMSSVFDGVSGRRYRVFDCEVMFGEDLTNLSVYGYYEGTCTIDPIENAADGYRYVIHVTYENGLACDYKVRVIDARDRMESVIQNEVRDCRYVLELYENCEDIQSSKDELEEFQSRASAIASQSEFNEIRARIAEIRETYESEISVDSVRADGLEDWWTTTVDETDDDDVLIGRKSVLRLERGGDVTDTDILNKLQLEFVSYSSGDAETLTYTMTELGDDSNYQALLKIKNPATGHVKYMYIRITEW